jgi:hypothetical protein
VDTAKHARIGDFVEWDMQRFVSRSFFEQACQPSLLVDALFDLRSCQLLVPGFVQVHDSGRSAARLTEMKH